MAGDTSNNSDIGDLSTVLQCLTSQLAPISPQPASRQVHLFHKYFQRIHSANAQQKQKLAEAGILTSDGRVKLSWLNPFVQCQSVHTFPGLALSSMVYGPAKEGAEHLQFELQKFTADNGGDSHPIFPSSSAHLFAWNECQQALFDLSHRHFPVNDQNRQNILLFSNEFTNNERPALIPAGEPFIVRFRLQNPFPFHLTLRNLCLSVSQIKLRAGSSPTFSDKFQSSTISALKILQSGERGDKRENGIPAGQRHHQLVDLHLLAGAEVESFEVDGIKFDLSPPLLASDQNGEGDQKVNADVVHPQLAPLPSFVPISVRGKRLFKTKEQRTSKVYGIDNRLGATVMSDSVPLLGFRPVGGDPAFIRAISHWQAMEGYADQIFQIVFEVENIGKVPADQIWFCTNLSEQVSISEPSTSGKGANRWQQCAAKCRQSSLFSDDPFKAIELGMETLTVGQFGQFGEQNPMEIGNKIGMRVAIRMSDRPQTFYFTFLYIGQNGHSHQFRFALSSRPLPRLLRASLCPLISDNSLFLLQLHCLPLQSVENAKNTEINAKATNNANATFAKLELLRISARYFGGEQSDWAKRGVRTTVKRMDNKPVLLESATKQNLCFYALTDKKNLSESEQKSEKSEIGDGWANSWLGLTFVPDIPEWHIGTFRREETTRTGRGDLSVAGQAENGQQNSENGNSLQLQLKLLWKASIVRADCTVNTVFGEYDIAQMVKNNAEELANL